MPYKFAIFDMDGTILDTLDDITDAVNHVLSEHGCPPRTNAEVCSFVGSGARKLIERSLPIGASDEMIDNILEEYKRYYADHANIKTKPYEGITEMLLRMREKGYKLAVLSNKPHEGVLSLCKAHFSEIFHIEAGERSGIPRKPAPDGVRITMESMGMSAADTVYIGDSEVDVATAENAGIPCISVDWGFRTKAQLEAAGAVCVVSTVAALEQELMK